MKCLGITKKITIVKGIGESNSSKINAFDNALIDAGIHDCNLIKVSSILAKKTSIVEEFEIEKGAFVPAVLSINQTTTSEEIVAGIGIGFNNQEYGFVMEAQGTNEKEVKKNLETSLIEMADNRKQDLTKTIIITNKNSSTKKYCCVLVAVVYLF